MKVTYYKKYTGKSNSIVDALKAIGVDSSLKNRKKIGALNGLSAGKKKDNIKMLELLKKGKLIKQIIKTNAEEYVELLSKYSDTYLNYGKYFFYSWTNAEKTFAKAKARVKAKKKTGTTCVVPVRWGFHDMGIPCDGFYGKEGKFAGYSKTLQKYLKKINTGEAIGKTIKQAVDAKLLKAGDIICFKDSTHTFAYTGVKYLVFDGGSKAEYEKTGILVDYSKVNKSRKISEILRWK